MFEIWDGIRACLATRTCKYWMLPHAYDDSNRPEAAITSRDTPLSRGQTSAMTETGAIEHMIPYQAPLSLGSTGWL